MSKRIDSKEDFSCPDIEIPTSENSPAPSEHPNAPAPYTPMTPLKVEQGLPKQHFEPSIPRLKMEEEALEKPRSNKLRNITFFLLASFALYIFWNRKPATLSDGMTTVSISPLSSAKTHVFVDGKLTRLHQGEIRVRPGAKLRVLRDGFAIVEREVKGSPSLAIELQPMKGGYLTTTLPPGTTLTLTNGIDSWRRTAPIEHLKMPEGSYIASIETVAGSDSVAKKLQFQISEGNEFYLSDEAPTK